ncbi:MAG: hypothetical protein R3B40_25730 [Polyangiales bacterium]
MNQWMRVGFVALCGVFGAGCLTETVYVCPPGSEVTASQRCGAACASGELDAEVCAQVRQACADGRLGAQDCVGLDVDMGVLDLGMDAAPPDMGDDLGPDLGPDLGVCGACGNGTVCDPDSMTCVQCVTAADCTGPLGQCNAMHQCVACLTEAHCDGSTPYCVAETCAACRNNGDCPLTDPVCDTVDHTCGSCQQRSDCNDRSATPACNTSTGDCTLCDIDSESADCPGQRCFNQTSCTECRPGTASVDCTMPSESRCNTIGECAACTMDAHCSHITGLPRCVGGTCRACTVTTEASDCSGNTCHPTMLTCTTTPRFSRAVCQSCVSDTECTQGGPGNTFRCVRMNFQGTDLGGFCLRAANVPAPSGWCSPFLTPIRFSEPLWLRDRTVLRHRPDRHIVWRGPRAPEKRRVLKRVSVGMHG